MWARLNRVVFAADREDAAAAGFGDREFYALLSQDRATGPTPIQRVTIDASVAPFDTWRAQQHHTRSSPRQPVSPAR